ncbi:hypothetical protein, conserved [Angomonas deanei]|uniref:Uncharacterized protein n=1 Tax=Angomonas deanei TaxID=59799 RepID=A0A7G2CP99_9TRYP|nr:hypothetical protein, conserved [Angomonas deanei]
MDLDKPILSRDVFLVLKYFRYGIEFAIDNELERMLRYFNEHAVNELKIIQDSKLMRGPPTLSRKKSVQVASSNSSRRDSLTPPLATGEGRGFQVLSHFPTVRGCLLQQFATPPSPSVVNTCKEVLQPPTPAQSFFSPASLKFRESPAAYDIADESQFSTLSPSAFRRPAVVIFSQLGQKFGSRADQEWRELAYKTICPTVLPYIRTKEPENEGTVPKTVKEPHQRKPIDVISLRSVDIYKYKWVHRLYIRRFANSLDMNSVPGIMTANSTYVGTRLLEPFYSVLGLRNYLLPQVMLVDHEGVIRWLSAGCPDRYEAEHFPKLLAQLEAEYYQKIK